MTQNSKETLLALLKTHSVLRGDFTLSSGQKSDTYIDVRRTILRSEGLHAAGCALYDLVHAVQASARYVGGLALGAVPLTTAVAYEAAVRGIDDFYSVIVRKAPKGHGTNKQVEPDLVVKPGTELVAIDDVITTAGSTLQAIAVLRDAGYVVNHAVSIIDREAGGHDALADAGVSLSSIFKLHELTH